MTDAQKSPLKKWDTQAILHTNHGDIHIKLFSKEVPKTVENFVGLSEKW